MNFGFVMIVVGLEFMRMILYFFFLSVFVFCVFE